MWETHNTPALHSQKKENKAGKKRRMLVNRVMVNFYVVVDFLLYVCYCMYDDVLSGSSRLPVPIQFVGTVLRTKFTQLFRSTAGLTSFLPPLISFG